MNGITAYVENMSKAQESLLLSLEMLSRKLIVQGAQRQDFLSPFVHLLKHKKQECKLQGPCQLAKLLCVMVDFRDCDNDQVTVDWRTIEKELIRLKKELYPDD